MSVDDYIVVDAAFVRKLVDNIDGIAHKLTWMHEPYWRRNMRMHDDIKDIQSLINTLKTHVRPRWR